MYARYWFRYVAKAGVGAALLRLLRVCQAVLLWVTPGALGSVWLFNGRTGELPEKATLYLHCESRRMLLRTEGVFEFPLIVITPRGPGILSLRYA